jgi:hypothetical protein
MLKTMAREEAEELLGSFKHPGASWIEEPKNGTNNIWNKFKREIAR